MNKQGSAVFCFSPWEIPLRQVSQPTLLDSFYFNSLPHSLYLPLCDFVVIIFYQLSVLSHLLIRDESELLLTVLLWFEYLLSSLGTVVLWWWFRLSQPEQGTEHSTISYLLSQCNQACPSAHTEGNLGRISLKLQHLHPQHALTKRILLVSLCIIACYLISRFNAASAGTAYLS